MAEQELCPVPLEALRACLARAYEATLRLDEASVTAPMNNRQRALLDDLTRQLERIAVNGRSLVRDVPGLRKLTAEDMPECARPTLVADNDPAGIALQGDNFRNGRRAHKGENNDVG